MPSDIRTVGNHNTANTIVSQSIATHIEQDHSSILPQTPVQLIHRLGLKLAPLREEDHCRMLRLIGDAVEVSCLPS